MGVEAALSAPEWEQGWLRRGVDITAHRQLPLVAADLARLGRTDPGHPRARPVAGLVLTSSAEALGALYVVEGSAIGRRVLSPLLQARLGDIPTRFFDGAGRQRQAWRDVQRCLAAVPDDEGQQREVLAGARRTFQIFLDQLGDRNQHFAPAHR